MIKFENTEVTGFEAAIHGMRNPLNSWHLSDSHKLDEWRELCKWIEILPHHELITGKEEAHED